MTIAIMLIIAVSIAIGLVLKSLIDDIFDN